jgi:hypothetical protein
MFDRRFRFRLSIDDQWQPMLDRYKRQLTSGERADSHGTWRKMDGG